MSTNKESWSGKVGLVLAMAGNAVGLGNFLRFPVQAIQNGGGAFIIPYLVCFVLLGIPLMWMEYAMGRFGGRRGSHAPPFIMDSLSRRRFWKYLGVFGIFTNLAVAAYYCYLESWTITYFFHSALGTFTGQSQEQVANFFDQYLSLHTNAGSLMGLQLEPLLMFIVCVALNAWVLSKGLAAGVEAISRIGMPLLLVFGIFLAIKGVTLEAGQDGARFSGLVGLNYLWEPQFDSLLNPKVWLAAAGQIFFTLSVGMGTIQCFAAYVKEDEDVALNALAAGSMNEFVEVVLGSAILIPISVGYLGLDKVLELAKAGGLGLGFRTMPYLFVQWGPVLGAVAGMAFFGLLFFAGITSSLAMGTPWMSFMQDEFAWKRNRSAWSFGALVLILGLPTVFFFNQGVFDEYDYWAGTVSLVVFALAEAILFAWIFGIERGWPEIVRGADVHVPAFFKPVIVYVTPLLLGAVFLGALITPAHNDWAAAFTGLTHGEGWPLDAGSIIAKLGNQDLRAKIEASSDMLEVARLKERIFYATGARLLLLIVWLGVAYLVYLAGQRRRHRYIQEQTAASS